MLSFYLVQRLESKNPRRTDAGFDGYFSIDYMGSAEFEWGAIPKALTAMCERPAQIEPADVTIGGITRTVYFVGHKGVSSSAADMEEWAQGGGGRRVPYYGKEWTYFDDAFAGKADPYRTTDAWWDILSNVGWALDEKVARGLQAAFNSRPRR